jgi:hypothetical protein
MNEYSIDICAGDSFAIRVVLEMPAGKTLLLGDKAVVMIRTHGGRFIWSEVFDPVQPDGFYFDWVMPHLLTEALEPRDYRWGLAIYCEATLGDDGMPIDGKSVEHAVTDAAFTLRRPTARERNIS